MKNKYQILNKNKFGEDKNGKATHSADPKDYDFDDSMDFDIEDR